MCQWFEKTGAQRAGAGEDVLQLLRRARKLLVAVRRIEVDARERADRQHLTGPDAEVHAREGDEARDEKARADKEDDGQRHFSDKEERARAAFRRKRWRNHGPASFTRNYLRGGMKARGP